VGRPKSFLPQLIIDYAKNSHNCRFNKTHRIAKGQKRLTVKEGREVVRYCPPCATHFLRLDIATIQIVISGLEQTETISVTQA